MKRIILAATLVAAAVAVSFAVPLAASADPAPEPTPAVTVEPTPSESPTAAPTETATVDPAPAEPAPTPTATPTVPIKARDGATRFRLVSTKDWPVLCSSMHGTDLVQIDYVFREHTAGVRGWRTIYVSSDGVRFVLVRTTQNPPWGCVPRPSMFKEPAEWADN